MKYTKATNFFSKYRKHFSILHILIVAEAILIIYGLGLFAVPEHQYIYSGNDLVSDYGLYFAYPGGYNTGCYLDNSIELNPGDTAMTISTPDIDLPRGSYQVSITYDTGDDTQHYHVSSAYNTYQVIAGHENVQLSPTEHQTGYSFFSPLKMDGYRICASYSGNSYLFIESISILETKDWKRVTLFWILLFSILLDSILFFRRKYADRLTKNTKTIAAVILFLTVFTSAPFLTYYMPGGHDLSFHLNRIEAIKDSLLAGQFPSRVSPYWNNGYGYAASVFYGELFLYLPAFLRLIGFTVQGAYKFYMLTVNLATGLITFYCLKKILKNDAAALAGCSVYLLSPYRLSCLYLRAAVGEYTAMSFFPLIFYGLYRIYTEDPNDKKNKGNWLWAAIGYTGILQCHILSCVMAGMFTLLFCIVFLKKTLQPGRFWKLCKVVGFVVLLNCWFLIPFLDYYHCGYSVKNINPLGRFNANGAFFSQLFAFFPQGYGASCSVAEGFAFGGEMSYALGAGLWIAGCFYFLYRINNKNKSAVSRIGDFSLFFGALALFMTTIWFPWDFIQQMNRIFSLITQNIQLPWRFLGMATFFFTLTTACLVYLLKAHSNRTLYYGATALIGSFMLLSSGYFLDNYTQNASINRYVDETQLTSSNIGLGEYLPPHTPDEFYADTALVPGAFLTISDSSRADGTLTVTCSNSSASDTCVDVPLLPYKGYVCSDLASGEKMSWISGENGKIRVNIPAGYSGSFTLKFVEPWYWRIGELISLLSLAALILFFLKKKKRLLLLHTEML